MADDISFWEEKWAKSEAHWHMSDVHPMLKQHIESLQQDGKKPIKIFFPCCGKAVDMKWLYDNGHCVVGVDVIEKPLTDFMSENDLEYEQELLPNGQGNVLKTKDGRLQLYNCDLLKFGPDYCGKFDLIWDRASLVALPVEIRKPYADALMSLMSPTSEYLVVVFDYDPRLRKGPPRSVPRSSMDQLYGGACDLKMVHEADSEEEFSQLNVPIIPGCMTRTYLITLKSMN